MPGCTRNEYTPLRSFGTRCAFARSNFVTVQLRRWASENVFQWAGERTIRSTRKLDRTNGFVGEKGSSIASVVSPFVTQPTRPPTGHYCSDEAEAPGCRDSAGALAPPPRGQWQRPPRRAESR